MFFLVGVEKVVLIPPLKPGVANLGISFWNTEGASTELYLEFGAHILQEFNIDDFQLIDDHFFSKLNFRSPYHRICEHSMTRNDQEAINTQK